MGGLQVMIGPFEVTLHSSATGHGSTRVTLSIVCATDAGTDGARAEREVAAMVGAAPGLLAALEALSGCAWHHSTCPAHPPGGDDGACNCGYVEAEDDARAAIAKARG